MKSVIRIALLLLLTSGNLFAGSEYDNCRKEEKVLRDSEADKCNGFAWLMNPSGCVAIRQDLQPYDAGKCWKLGGRENSKNGSANKRLPPPVAALPALAPELPEPTTPQQQSEIEKLRTENELLKKELIRLQEELARLRAPVK